MKTEPQHQLMTPGEVAQFLRVSEITLRRMRERGDGPRARVLSGRCVRYMRDDVLSWFESLDGAPKPRRRRRTRTAAPDSK